MVAGFREAAEPEDARGVGMGVLVAVGGVVGVGVGAGGSCRTMTGRKSVLSLLLSSCPKTRD